MASAGKKVAEAAKGGFDSNFRVRVYSLLEQVHELWVARNWPSYPRVYVPAVLSAIKESAATYGPVTPEAAENTLGHLETEADVYTDGLKVGECGR